MKNESDNLFDESDNSKKPIVVSKEERMGLMAKGVPQFEKVRSKYRNRKQIFTQFVIF
jgi:hypothetical protein